MQEFFSLFLQLLPEVHQLDDPPLNVVEPLLETRPLAAVCSGIQPLGLSPPVNSQSFAAAPS